MQPFILVDKSFLESISKRESEALHRHYRLIVPPILLQEIITDLAKSKYKPDEKLSRVIALSLKSDGVGHFTIDDARTLFYANLDGCDFKLEPRIPRFDGVEVPESDGSTGVVLFETPEQKLLRRWQDGGFTDEDRRVAKKYLKDIEKYYSHDHHSEMKAGFPVNARFKSVDELVHWTDTYALTSSEAWSFIEISSKMARMPDHDLTKARMRWEAAGCPPLRDFYPYSFFFSRVFDIYSLALTSALIPASRSANAVNDIQYFLYLPFVHIFCSGDKFHRDNFKYFARRDQHFAWGNDLKKDLADIAAFHENLSSEESLDYKRLRGSYPPPIANSITAELWCEINGPWTEESFGNRAIDMSPEESRKLADEIFARVAAAKKKKDGEL